MRLTFCLDMPKIHVSGRGRVRPREWFAPLVIALEALTSINQLQLKRHRIPPLYESGVFYRPEEYPREEWLDAPTAYKRGFADCEDLATWLAAELRNRHRDNRYASPVLKSRDIHISPTDVITVVHVLVRYRNGRIEDPSKILGMRGEYQ